MVQKYLNRIFQKYKTGDASEKTYYSVLENFLEEFSKSRSQETTIIIEPRRTKIGIPDFKLKTSKGLLIGYIEAKDLGADLDKLNKVDEKQIDKYLKEYPKLILTNFIEFRLYENKIIDEIVQITEPVTLKLKTPVLKNEPKLIGLLEKFLSTTIKEIYTSKRLAELLAHKTHVLRDLLVEEINLEDKEVTSTEQLFEVFKKTLLHSITPEQFADMYAQTVTYGLFVARLNSGDKFFNRTTALDFIPETIPLLKRLFHIISGQKLPQHIAWHVDEIAEILAKTKIEKIKEEFFAEGKGRDPIIHFYETFLKEFDPKERERRGVYYTPEQVVSYIVKSIDTLLKNVFGKKDGFADSSVLVLDPAAGTLTFPAKAIAVAKDEFSESFGEGGWKSLVKDHILKNFYAFELLMAPYSVGHLKIGLMLEELGYKLTQTDRFKLFLTNTLEMEKVESVPMLLAPEISEESEAAYKVKDKTPILVIFGNPPYSGISENKGKWILKQIQDYTHVDGKPLGERKHWLQDDYVKFFRFAQWKIEKTGVGILGFITNHAWLDNPTFRGMRASLLKTFDDIYILNLHGSTLKKEKTPEGGKDENVFDIQPGVAITIGLKIKDAKNKRVFYADFWGLREEKYNWLEKNDINSTDWQIITPLSPYYFFIPTKEKGREEYQKFISIQEIFPVNSTGIVTARDEFVIDHSKQSLESKIRIFLNPNNSDEYIKEFLKGILGRREAKDVENYAWRVSEARQQLRQDKNWEEHFTRILYRPFDERWIFYHSSVVWRTRENVMRHMLRPNLGLCIGRAGAVIGSNIWDIALITSEMTDFNLYRRGGNLLFPLYLYNNEKKQQQISFLVQGGQKTSKKKPNIDQKLSDDLAKIFNKKLSPEEIFYYTYAILYSDIYRKKYQEFLKRDFPRVPFTKNYKLFQNLSEVGKQLVDLHVLKSSDLNNPVAKFHGSDGNLVEKLEYKKEGRQVYINKIQYFDGVGPEVWNYHIGGYQVLDKWLKGRKGRTLSSDDIKHYCKIVTALSKTIQIQKQIDKLYPEVEKNLISFD